ncbi:MAG: hypothetical protein J0M24_21495 [Verrucomicrobia bacterium]|nr:hypothetical protein [Verrucomicrobiota bacterium]
MTETEQRLLEQLRELEADVARQPRPDLRPRLVELDRLTRALPTEADPELRHFLQRRSYEKARLFLENRANEIPRVGCTRTQDSPPASR